MLCITARTVSEINSSPQNNRQEGVYFHFIDELSRWFNKAGLYFRVDRAAFGVSWVQTLHTKKGFLAAKGKADAFIYKMVSHNALLRIGHGVLNNTSSCSSSCACLWRIPAVICPLVLLQALYSPHSILSIVLQDWLIMPTLQIQKPWFRESKYCTSQHSPCLNPTSCLPTRSCLTFTHTPLSWKICGNCWQPHFCAYWSCAPASTLFSVFRVEHRHFFFSLKQPRRCKHSKCVCC